MEFITRVRKTDLARNTRQVIRAVQRGQTAIVESHGQPEAAIIDILDYRILRAVMRYYAQRAEIDAQTGLTDEEVTALTNIQDRYNLVIAYYLAEAISLSRAAELLGLSWLDLRTRFLRLDVPLRTAPSDLTEARADVKAAMEEKLLEIFGDPDEGLEIGESVRDRLLRQRKAVIADERGAPFEDVVRRLGLA